MPLPAHTTRHATPSHHATPALSGELREQALRTGRSVVHSALAWYLDLPQNTWLSMYELELPRAPPAALLGGEASSWGEHCDATNLQQVVPISPTLSPSPSPKPSP